MYFKKRKKWIYLKTKNFTWEVCVHTTAWERRTHFCCDFRRRWGGGSAQCCSAVLQRVPGEPQNWALGCSPRSSHLEQENRFSAPSAQEWCNISCSGLSDRCLHCLTTGDSTQPYKSENSLQLPLLISIVLCFSLLLVLSQYVLGICKALKSYLRSILILPWRGHFSRR